MQDVPHINTRRGTGSKRPLVQRGMGETSEEKRAEGVTDTRSPSLARGGALPRTSHTDKQAACAVTDPATPVRAAVQMYGLGDRSLYNEQDSYSSLPLNKLLCLENVIDMIGPDRTHQDLPGPTSNGQDPSGPTRTRQDPLTAVL
ncbi:unnamed protein product [Pleuronectes platessa]|uniref:Uncharacterized protein n=1 Tax=Pleuronectes platessa TaxID=8262 RepID=A0A9N7W3L1_PLEPL|nr:unnamed protein product [Pleuronectes platessa]